MLVYGMLWRHGTNVPSILALQYTRNVKYIPTRTNGFIGDLGSYMQFVVCISVLLVAKINTTY
jgi:hypothetical protein